MSPIELGPLRLSEIAKLRGYPLLKPFSNVNNVSDWTEKEFWLKLIRYASSKKLELENSFEAFSSYGGYPICHSSGISDKSELAAQIVENVIERTISHEKADGASEEIVKNVFELLCRYAGDRVAVKEIANQVSVRIGQKITHAEVQSALDYLEDTLLVRLLKPLEVGRKKQNAHPTICLCDHFLRYALLKEDIPLTPKLLKGKNEQVAAQAGHIVEGIIGNFFASMQGVNASCFPGNKNQPEVDIVLSIGTKRIPIEVKYRRKQVSCAQLAGIKFFCERPHHEAGFGLVVTQEQAGEIKKNIIAIPAKTLLLLL